MVDGIIDSMGMSLSKLRETVKDREAWHVLFLLEAVREHGKGDVSLAGVAKYGCSRLKPKKKEKAA